jgi:phenylpropionate dioxygenase-like ring-hydroxylating dioxygenase large terminal subunit
MMMRIFLPLLVMGTTGGMLAVAFQSPLPQTMPTRGLSRSSLLVSKATVESVDTDMASTTDSSSSSTSGFDAFDYTNHWYPVVWAEDVLPLKPTKVTLFDIDYVVGKLDNDSVICMEDRCPHKSAALSEGRITASGNFQCAYHGWSFNGTDGSCVEIPQVASLPPSIASFSSRTCGKARPCQISQGMVWVYPGGGWEEASAAPPPPRIPEYDLPGFKVGGAAIRDFPIDFSVLLENIMDPDHGLFAHGATTFDQYSASKDVPQSLEEEVLDNGKGWTITSRVSAVEKLLSIDKTLRGTKKAEAAADTAKVATTVFVAPNLVYMGRRDRETGNTFFINAFLICPTGVGRSRFMSCSITKAPFFPPRWLMHLVLNNFLDQDTHLLATQQKHVLQWEAAAAVKAQKEGKTDKAFNTRVRKQNYVYQSPTEKLGVRLGAFFDATLSNIPGRTEKLLELSASGSLLEAPQRESTLDRRIQHLAICPGSQRVVRNCERVVSVAKVLSVAVAALKLLVMSSTQRTVLNRLLSPTRMGLVWGMTSFAGWMASKIRREFFFKYTSDLRDADLESIPQKVWLDK